MAYRALTLGVNSKGLRYSEGDAVRLGEALKARGYECLDLARDKGQIQDQLDAIQDEIAKKEWSPELSDAYFILTASERLEKAKEIEALEAGFLTHHICQALSRNAAGLADAGGAVRIGAIYEYLKRGAEQQNGQADAPKVPIPNLTGNIKHNFPLLDAEPGGADTPLEPFTLYLTEVSDDLIKRRDEVKRYLEQIGRQREREGRPGVRILPEAERQPPQVFDSAEELRNLLRHQLEQSQLFVQLLSQVEPPRSDRLHDNMGQWQAARELEMEIWQWCDPRVIALAEDPGQQRLLAELTVKAVPINDFKDGLRRRLDQTRQPAPTVTDADAAQRMVFVYAAPEDRELAERVEELLRLRGIGYMSLTDDEDSRRRERVQTFLEACDALLMLHGKSDSDWVDYGLLDCRKGLAGRPDRRHPPIGLCQVPPPDKTAPAVHIPGLKVLKMLPDRLEQGLTDCLAQLAIAPASGGGA